MTTWRARRRDAAAAVQAVDWRRALPALLLVAVPWLDPAAYGPTAAAIPWLVSAACALALWGVASRGFRLPLVPSALAWLAVAWVLWAALSQFAVRPELAMLAGGLAVVVLAAASARAGNLAAALQVGLLLAAALNAVIGLLQYFGAAAPLSPLVNVADIGEAYGNLRQTNQFATLCWIGTAILLFGTLRLPRAAAIAMVVLLAASSAATGSRTGLLEIVVLLALAAWWRGPERRARLVLAGVALVAYAVAALALPLLLEVAAGTAKRELWERLGAGDGCFSRRVLWSNVLHLIALKPLTGWGWGELDYAHFMTLYPGARFCEILDNGHNLPLHLAVELGLPAALLASGGALWWAWRRRPWGEAMPLRRLAWALLGLIAVHSLVEYPLWYGSFQIAAGIALGWLWPPVLEPAASSSRRRALVCAGLLCTSLAYAAFDYARVSQAYLEPQARWRPWRERTLEHAKASWLFSGQARFADLTLATPTRANAREMYALSQQVLHYSPEPRVIERAIESAVLVGREDEALLHLMRFRAAFPTDYESWRQRQRQALPP